MDRIGDAERLKKLYEERSPKGMSQSEFGARFNIGNQSMVSQYLNGARPLNIEAVAKFAKGLDCNIRDISPTIAQALEADIVPMLGSRALKRAIAKMAIAVAAIFTIPPTPAHAHTRFDITLSQYTLRLKAFLRSLGRRFA